MGYIKQNFEDGLTLFASQLNHIEDGIVALENGASKIKWQVISDGEVFELSTEKEPIVAVPCTGITLNKTNLTINDTETVVTLVATVTPFDNTDPIVWSVDKSGVVTVENGVVKAIANGSCVITATCGDYSATCSVTVNIVASATKANLDGYWDFVDVEDNYFGTLTNKAENGTLTGEVYKNVAVEGYADPASVENGVLVFGVTSYLGGSATAASTKMKIYDADTEKFYTTYPYSVEFYGKFSSNTNTLIQTRYNGQSGTDVSFSDDSTIKTTGAIGQGNNTIALVSAVDVTAYHHYVVCVDSALVRVYIDGVMMGEGTVGNNSMASTGPLHLMASHCRLKMCRVYNAILTDEQVVDNYANAIAMYGGDA